MTGMPDQIGNTELRFVTEAGDEIIGRVAEHRIAAVGRAQPVRLPPSHAGQRHYSGLIWTRTTSQHVVYESLLERDRILLADFDPTVMWIAAQPFWIRGVYQNAHRRHCPDLLLTRNDGSLLVVDVKNSRVAQKDAAKVVFAWTREVCSRLGASYEVWTGTEPTYINNVRFAAQSRRESRAARLTNEWHSLPDVVAFAEAEQALESHGVERPRHLILELLWTGMLDTDLTAPLSGETVLRRPEAA